MNWISVEGMSIVILIGPEVSGVRLGSFGSGWAKL